MEDKMAGTSQGGKKASEGGRGNFQKASPIAIEKYIKGTDFPADKNQLLQQAKNNKAPEDIINTLNKMEEKEYRTPIDISKEVGKIE
jgi:hypothetical protein